MTSFSCYKGILIAIFISLPNFVGTCNHNSVDEGAFFVLSVGQYEWACTGSFPVACGHCVWWLSVLREYMPWKTNRTTIGLSLLKLVIEVLRRQSHIQAFHFCVDFSFCCSNCRSCFSLEQNCWFIVDKLSSTAVDFIRSEGIAERQHLIWGKTSSLSMPRT